MDLATTTTTPVITTRTATANNNSNNNRVCLYSCFMAEVKTMKFSVSNYHFSPIIRKYAKEIESMLL